MPVERGERMEVYALRLDGPLPPGWFAACLARAPEERRARVARARTQQAARRCLLGEMLPRWLACAALGVTDRALQTEKGPAGKPFFAGWPGFHYNVSHAGDWVVCAVGESPVGVDIEGGRRAPLRVASRFAPPEREAILAAEEPAQAALFFRYWTAKESYVKYLGRGLTLSLDAFTLLPDGPDCFAVEEDPACAVRIFHEAEGFPAALCGAREAVARARWTQLRPGQIVFPT